MKISRDVIRFMYFQMCIYYVLHVITLLWIFVIEKHINLEKNFPLKKIEELLRTLNQKKPRGVMKYYFTCKGFEKLVITFFTVKKPLI